jgi:hypothetical protein
MNYCENCNKKIPGLITYNCKCKYNKLCNNCKFPENHNCEFDYKSYERTKILNENPKITSKKIDLI